MKVSKIQQLLLRQNQHDEMYHADIYYQKTIDKLKHFTLHLTKYFCSLVLKDSIEKNIVNSILISLSIANTLKCEVPDLTFKVYPIKESLDELELEYARILRLISKSLDSLDHIEVFDSRCTLETSLQNLILLLNKYISYYSETNFENAILLQYQAIADKRLR